MVRTITFDPRAAEKRAYRHMMETPAYVPAPAPARARLTALAALALSVSAFGIVFFVA